MGGEYHRLSLQWQWRHPGVRKLSRPQIDRSVHGGFKEGGPELPAKASAH